jgi:hypothetical protein
MPDEETRTTGVAAIPDNLCSICMRGEAVAGEILMCVVAFPNYGGRKKLCLECEWKLRHAIENALKSVGWWR